MYLKDMNDLQSFIGVGRVYLHLYIGHQNAWVRVIEPQLQGSIFPKNFLTM